MTAIDSIQRALVIAPHPDDEVLGCGGTMARLIAMGRKETIFEAVNDN